MTDVDAQAGHQPPADALVLFGATGDLAKRKLFPALYHLVRRGELKVPVIGVARSDWTDDDFRQPRPGVRRRQRRRRRRAVIDDMCGRLDLIQGDYAAPDDVAVARRHARRLRLADRRVLHGDPARHVPDGRREAGLGRAQRARPDRRREAVRPRPRVGPRAEPTRCTRSSPRSASSASTTTSARRPSRTSSCSASRTCCSSRCGTGTTCAACRSRWPSRSASRAAAASTRASARSATCCRTTCCRSCACWRWSRRSIPTPSFLQDEKAKVLAAMEPIDPRCMVRGQYIGYREEPGVDPHSTVETYVAARLQIDSWRWAGVPWYVRCRQGARPRRHGGGRRAARPAAAAVRRGRRPAARPQPDPLPARQERRRHVRAAGQDARPAPRQRGGRHRRRLRRRPRRAPRGLRAADPRRHRRLAAPLRPLRRRRAPVGRRAAGARRARRRSTRTSARPGARPRPTASSAATAGSNRPEAARRRVSSAGRWPTKIVAWRPVLVGALDLRRRLEADVGEQPQPRRLGEQAGVVGLVDDLGPAVGVAQHERVLGDASPVGRVGIPRPTPGSGPPRPSGPSWPP